MCKSRDIKTRIRFMKNDVIGDVVTIEKKEREREREIRGKMGKEIIEGRA